MSAISARVLELLTLLQSRRHWSGQELARRLEVSPRTLRRDVESLQDLGYPITTTRGLPCPSTAGAPSIMTPANDADPEINCRRLMLITTSSMSRLKMRFRNRLQTRQPTLR